MRGIGRNPFLVQMEAVVSSDFTATPRGMGSISTTSTRMERSPVTQTLAPVSAIDIDDCG